MTYHVEDDRIVEIIGNWRSNVDLQANQKRYLTININFN